MEKDKKDTPSPNRGRGTVTVMIFCFAAALVMAGVFTLRNMQKKKEMQLAKEKEQTEQLKKQSHEAAANDIINPVQKSADSVRKENETKESEAKEGEDKTEEPAGGSAVNVWFDEKSTLHWPASGSVLIPFSMDQTVYFPTLEQYKYNPAMIIGGTTGELITASAPGIVVNVEESAKTGVTVTLNMGNGYCAVYGQLQNVGVAQGDYVEDNARLGELCEPTKYYSLDGPNLYFELQKDGVPVDPLDYMEP